MADREASWPSTQVAARTKAREYAPDLRNMLEDKTRQTRSIYRSRRHPTARDGNCHASHKFGRAEHSRQSSLELRRDIAQYRGVAHPLCFIDEVMDHQIPEGFKPVNIESYDGTTDPAVWIEDFLWPAETIYMPSSIFPLTSKDLPGTG